MVYLSWISQQHPKCIFRKKQKIFPISKKFNVRKSPFWDIFSPDGISTNMIFCYINMYYNSSNKNFYHITVIGIIFSIVFNHSVMAQGYAFLVSNGADVSMVGPVAQHNIWMCIFFIAHFINTIYIVYFTYVIWSDLICWIVENGQYITHTKNSISAKNGKNRNDYFLKNIIFS